MTRSIQVMLGVLAVCLIALIVSLVQQSSQARSLKTLQGQQQLLQQELDAARHTVTTTSDTLKTTQQQLAEAQGLTQQFRQQAEQAHAHGTQVEARLQEAQAKLAALLPEQQKLQEHLARLDTENTTLHNNSSSGKPRRVNTRSSYRASKDNTSRPRKPCKRNRPSAPPGMKNSSAYGTW